MKPWTKRAIRTFFQAFAGTLAAQLTAYQGQELTRTIIISLLASAVAGGISAVMNVKER